MNKVGHAKFQLVMVQAMNLVYLANDQGKEYGENYKGKELIQAVLCSIYSLMNAYLITELTDNVKYKMLTIWVNIIAMWLCIFAKCFEYQLSTTDLILSAVSMLSSLISASMFGFVFMRIKRLMMNQEVKVNELKLFKDMFDCLQEGIIVIEKDFENAFRLFFANNLAKRILA